MKISDMTKALGALRFLFPQTSHTGFDASKGAILAGI